LAALIHKHEKSEPGVTLYRELMAGGAGFENFRNRQPTAASSSKSLAAQRIDVRLDVPTDTARLPL
jgi:hypothetical protein